MKLKQLLEVYETSLKRNKGHVFVNPSHKEMMTVAEKILINKKYILSLRFFADNKTKKLYVWNSNFLHDLFFKKMEEYKDIDRYDDDYIFGIINFKNRKWEYDYNIIDLVNFKSKKRFKNIDDFKWLDNYFSFSPVAKQNKKK